MHVHSCRLHVHVPIHTHLNMREHMCHKHMSHQTLPLGSSSRLVRLNESEENDMSPEHIQNCTHLALVGRK